MRLIPRRLVATASIVLTSPLAAQDWDSGPPRDHDITIEDYFGLGYLSSCAMAPGGDRVAYTEMRWELHRDARNTDIWVVDATSQRRLRLTFDPAADTDPQWGPEGRWIYFASARGEGDTAPTNGKRQVWRVRAEGGSAMAVTREPDGIKAFELARDGTALYYTTASEQHEDDRWLRLRKKFDGLEHGHGIVSYDALHRLDLESWRSEKLVDERRVIRLFAVSPDQQRIAMITAPNEHLISYEGWSEVDVFDVEDRVVRRLPDTSWRAEAPSPYGWIVTPAWSDDAEALAFRVDFDGYPGQLFVADHSAGTPPRIQRIERPDEVHAEGDVRWRPGTRDLCFLAEYRARARVYTVRDVREGRQGEGYPLTPRDVVVNDFDFGRRGDDMAVLMAGLDHPPDVFAVEEAGPDAAYRRLTRANPQVDRWKLPQIEQIRWTSPDGTEIEGILELPFGYRREEPLPLVVQLHGGPTASTKYAMQFSTGGRTLFAARGWALFSPNYRGSTGYGDSFLTQLIGNKNNLDVADIESGIDWLVARGIADPQRIAVMGWSNGGYLTNCLIARSDRYRAASSGAGVFDVVMQWAIEDTPGHVINYQEGLPWEQAESMRRASALYDVDRIRTPTLIHVGEKDERVPAAHSRALYRALHQYVGVPTELIVYPGAGHGLTKPSHRRAKITWDVEWFDYHVLGRGPSEP
ncbi:MAG: S9 family peptidase [Planctomycetota bacterium]|jgi:dipeptidyl aminopeptidase/acylaminoacyl peptidase